MLPERQPPRGIGEQGESLWKERRGPRGRLLALVLAPAGVGFVGIGVCGVRVMGVGGGLAEGEEENRGRKKRRESESEREKIRGKISPPLPPFPCSIRHEKFAAKSIDLLDPIRRSVDRFARALGPPVSRSGRSRRR